MSIDELIALGIVGAAPSVRVTIPVDFQGLPETAHGGSVLAVFDAAARRVSGAEAGLHSGLLVQGPREVSATYRRRVPLGTPLDLDIRPIEDATRFELRDPGHLLVAGHVTRGRDISPIANGASNPGDPALGPDRPGEPLPVSLRCFACGVENEVGLRVALASDSDAVWATYRPREAARTASDDVTTAALTTLLDETAFWLGALQTGESGMTTEIRVTLHRAADFARPLIVSGWRRSVRPQPTDSRYWLTETAIHDDGGELIATGRITFVQVRGTARRLAAAMLAVNPPDVVRRVFPAHV